MSADSPADPSGAVLSPEELAALHPLERVLCEDILAQIEREHGRAYLERNRELIRGQIELVMGPLGG